MNMFFVWRETISSVGQNRISGEEQEGREVWGGASGNVGRGGRGGENKLVSQGKKTTNLGRARPPPPRPPNSRTFREEQTRLAINGRIHIHHTLPAISKHLGRGGWGRGGGGEGSSDTTYMLGPALPPPFPRRPPRLPQMYVVLEAPAPPLAPPPPTFFY